MGDEIEITFLQDGKQAPETMAHTLGDFLSAARSTIEIAIYDCALEGDAATIVGEALRSCKERGVQVRVAYYAGPHQNPTVPPPYGSSEAFLTPLGVPAKPITGYGALMHHKYVVRDGGADDAAIWTGSMNWTVDSWSREENVVVRFPSSTLAQLYRADFEEMWQKGTLDDTGKRDGGSTTLQYGGDEVPSTVWFSPGLGRAMAHAVAAAIPLAQSRIVLCSPVITVGTILGALGDVLEAGKVPLRGIVDATQMAQVRRQWRENPAASWKIAAFDTLMQSPQLVGKHSTPFGPNTVHDFMHAKMIVLDYTVFLGSYNFSHSGEENAENLLRFDSPALADTCCSFVDSLIARYGSVRG